MKMGSPGFRVHLKAPGPGDAEEIARNANDYDIAHDVASSGDFPYPYRLEDAKAFIDMAVNARVSGSAHHFVICLDDDKAIGACGLFNIDSKNRVCEIGYWLGKAHWGKGYAKEAVSLLLQFGFGELKLNRIEAHTFATNERSAGLLQSIGFRNEGTLRSSVIQEGRFVDNMLFSILCTEYKSIPIEIGE